MSNKDNKTVSEGLANAVKDLNKVFGSGTFGLSNTTSSKMDSITDSNMPETCTSCCGCESSKCHGCDGKGWVENSIGDVKRCPVCYGKGVLDNSMINVVPTRSPGFNTSDDVKCYEYYITC